jgi:hypothetical protein
MDPDELLRAVIGKVYETFGKYPQPTGLEASPLCDPAELQVLITKPLRHLDVADLSGYAMWAMTTVGEVEDYKYFLPRILELAIDSGVVEPEIVALKLQYGHWHHWSGQERNAVIAAFQEACLQALKMHTGDYLADSWFCGMAILHLDLQSIMRAWESASSSNAALQLTEMLRSTLLFERDLNEMGYWSDVQIEVIQTIRAWLLGPVVHAKLMSASLAIASRDIWMLDRALEERDRLIGQQVQ